jgi:DNA processing protein
MPQEGSQPTREELRAWLRLSLAGGIGPVRGQILLQRFGPPEAILDAGFGPVAEVLRSSDLAHTLFGPDPARDAAIAGALRWLDGASSPGIGHGDGLQRSLLPLGDHRYPPRLLDLADPPLLLYCTGDPAWLGRPQVAIVGSRNATALGADTAWALAAALAAAGWTVVSGLAEGIDRAAHRGALAVRPGNAGSPESTAGSTVAALGTGVDRIYPSRNRTLAQEIAKQGALVSELPIGMQPLPANFPRRNRLIAALAHGVLVVEANPRSGSLITARVAADLGREVLAVPGSIHSPLARGCNGLIRQGATLVESVDDILAELPPVSRLGLRLPFTSGSMASSPTAGTPPSAADRPTTQALFRPGPAAVGPLPEAQARMLSAMSADPVMLELLAARQSLPVASALAALQTLELNGLVQRQLDGSYIRCP